MQVKNNSTFSIVTLKKYPLTFRKNKTERKCKFLIKVILSAVSLILIFALPAIACGGPSALSGWRFASMLFYFPAISITLASFIPFIVIIPTEAFILHKRESISFIKSIGLATVANVFYIIFISLSLIIDDIISYIPFPLLYFLLLLLQSLIYTAMCLSFCHHPFFLKQLDKRIFIFLIYLAFTGLNFIRWVITVIIQSSLNPASLAFLYAITSGLIFIGFIVSFLTKGFAIARLLKEKRPTLAATVMSMQVASFPIIAVAFYLTILHYRY